jgi:hypothetical protein
MPDQIASEQVCLQHLMAVASSRHPQHHSHVLVDVKGGARAIRPRSLVGRFLGDVEGRCAFEANPL